jgi:ATP-dependent Clp protease ATP-binding subunit ClpA
MGFRSGTDAARPGAGRSEQGTSNGRFPPEFRNRIDEVVLFQPLTHDEVRQIAIKYIDQVTATLKRWNKSVTVEPEALEKLVTDGLQPRLRRALPEAE